MKVVRKETQVDFVPVTLEITIESKEELWTLWSRFDSYNGTLIGELRDYLQALARNNHI